MFIPDVEQRDSANYNAHALHTIGGLSNNNGSIAPKGWSSLIGIITAIVGNVLISVALNTQRYAHIRLNKEYKEKRRKALEDAKLDRVLAHDEGRKGSQRLRRDDTLKRRHTDAQYKHRGSEDGSLDGPQETDPLIPRGEDEDAQPHELDELPMKERDESEGGQKTYLKSPYWWIGLILMIVGEAGNFLAYGFAPASIVSPLGVVALVSNCMIAPFMLKERFRKRDFLGVLIAVGGAVTVVVSAKQSNPKLGPKEIWKLIGTWEFETYLGLTTVAIIVLMFLSTKYGESSIFIDLGLVGLFGGYTALSTKGVASMLSYTLFKALTFPVTYLLAAVLVFTAVMQIRYLNRALQLFPSTQVIPTQFVLFTLSVILGSAVLYRDFERMEASNVGEFVGGCALTFSGVWLITSGRKQSDEDDDEFDEDAEEITDHISLIDDERTQTDEITQLSRTSSAQPTTPFQMSVANSRRASKASPQSPQLKSFEPVPQTPTTPGSMDQTLAGQGYFEDNPWLTPDVRESTNGQRPALYSSRSEPMIAHTLPTSSHKAPETPEMLPSLAAHSHGNSQSGAAHTHAVPTTPRTNPTNPLRNSFTEFVPGPLLTPLSSSLSAVVAHTLRRGVDSTSIKRRRSIARNRLPDRPSPFPHSPHGTQARGASEADLDAAAATMESLPANAEETDNLLPPADDGTPSKSRRRALDEAFGKLFRRAKSRDGESGGEQAAPPV